MLCPEISTVEVEAVRRETERRSSSNHPLYSDASWAREQVVIAQDESELLARRLRKEIGVEGHVERVIRIRSVIAKQFLQIGVDLKHSGAAGQLVQAQLDDQSLLLQCQADHAAGWRSEVAAIEVQVIGAETEVLLGRALLGLHLQIHVKNSRPYRQADFVCGVDV